MIFLMVNSEAFDPVRAEGAENLIPQITGKWTVTTE